MSPKDHEPQRLRAAWVTKQDLANRLLSVSMEKMRVALKAVRKRFVSGTSGDVCFRLGLHFHNRTADELPETDMSPGKDWKILLKILIVDDDRLSRMLFGRALERA